MNHESWESTEKLSDTYRKTYSIKITRRRKQRQHDDDDDTVDEVAEKAEVKDVDIQDDVNET